MVQPRSRQSSQHRSSTHIKCSLAPPSYLLQRPTTTSVLLGSYADILLSVILGLYKVQRRRNFDALSKLHRQSCFLHKVFKEELLTWCSTCWRQHGALVQSLNSKLRTFFTGSNSFLSIILYFEEKNSHWSYLNDLVFGQSEWFYDEDIQGRGIWCTEKLLILSAKSSRLLL